MKTKENIYVLNLNEDAISEIESLVTHNQEEKELVLIVSTVHSENLTLCVALISYLQQNYSHVTAVLLGNCTGYAAFLAYAADALVFSDQGGLGQIPFQTISERNFLAGLLNMTTRNLSRGKIERLLSEKNYTELLDYRAAQEIFVHCTFQEELGEFDFIYYGLIAQRMNFASGSNDILFDTPQVS